MMNLREAIENRRSVKHYDAAHTMNNEEIEQLLKLTVLSPTACNIQNWRSVVVSDAELRKKIRAASWDRSQVTDASLFVILCVDSKKKQPERYWRNAPNEVQDFMLPTIDDFYI